MTHPYDLIARAHHLLLRYETEHVPCTGVTAVTRQERRTFKNGIMIAPWHSGLTEAKRALDRGAVVDCGVAFEIPNRKNTLCRLFQTADSAMPVLYLGTEAVFKGIRDPYDTPELKSDALWFGVMVTGLLEMARKASGSSQLPLAPWVNGADWLTVPALHLLRGAHTCVLTLHNILDQMLATEARAFGPPFDAFGADRTALQVGIEECDVVTTVNEGFAAGLREDLFHRMVSAGHLRTQVRRIVGVDNGPFAPLTPALLDLKVALETDLSEGCERLRVMKGRALESLPEDIRRRAKGKIVFVCMGRRSAQKQHDLFVESLRDLLRNDPALPVLAVFATTAGGAGDRDRLTLIQELAASHPENVLCVDGRLEYFEHLLNAAHFNVLASLFEPHGGAFHGLVVPVARAVDGLAAQISAFRPTGPARLINERWHPADRPNGFLFREEPLDDLDLQRRDFEELMSRDPSPRNETFRRMTASLSNTIVEAMRAATDRFGYARLVAGALDRQTAWDWSDNFAKLEDLVNAARAGRTRTPQGGSAVLLDVGTMDSP